MEKSSQGTTVSSSLFRVGGWGIWVGGGRRGPARVRDRCGGWVDGGFGLRCGAGGLALAKVLDLLGAERAARVGGLNGLLLGREGRLRGLGFGAVDQRTGLVRWALDGAAETVLLRSRGVGSGGRGSGGAGRDRRRLSDGRLGRGWPGRGWPIYGRLGCGRLGYGWLGREWLGDGWQAGVDGGVVALLREVAAEGASLLRLLRGLGGGRSLARDGLAWRLDGAAMNHDGRQRRLTGWWLGYRLEASVEGAALTDGRAGRGVL